MGQRELRTTKGYGPLTRGDRIRLTDPEDGSIAEGTVCSACWYADDPEGTILWSLRGPDGGEWDLFPADLKDPSYEKLEA